MTAGGCWCSHLFLGGVSGIVTAQDSALRCCWMACRRDTLHSARACRQEKGQFGLHLAQRDGKTVFPFRACCLFLFNSSFEVCSLSLGVECLVSCFVWLRLASRLGFGSLELGLCFSALRVSLTAFCTSASSRQDLTPSFPTPSRSKTSGGSRPMPDMYHLF